jgi:hypothetical protein
LECSKSDHVAVELGLAGGDDAAHGVAPFDVLDLHDLGTEVGEQRRRCGDEGVLGHLEDPDPVEDLRHRRSRRGSPIAVRSRPGGVTPTPVRLG